MARFNFFPLCLSGIAATIPRRDAKEESMPRRIYFPIVLALVAPCGALLVRADRCAADEFYRIAFKLKEGMPSGSRESGTLRVLAEPQVVTAPNRDVDFHVGEEHIVGGQSLKVGVTFRFWLEPASNGQIRIVGNLECLNLLKRAEDFAAIESTRIYFGRNMPIGETATFRLKGEAAQQQWVEIAITRFPNANEQAPLADSAP